MRHFPTHSEFHNKTYRVNIRGNDTLKSLKRITHLKNRFQQLPLIIGKYPNSFPQPCITSVYSRMYYILRKKLLQLEKAKISL